MDLGAGRIRIWLMELVYVMLVFGWLMGLVSHLALFLKSLEMELANVYLVLYEIRILGDVFVHQAIILSMGPVFQHPLKLEVANAHVQEMNTMIMYRKSVAA
jgi:hypothetical protein